MKRHQKVHVKSQSLSNSPHSSLYTASEPSKFPSLYQNTTSSASPLHEVNDDARSVIKKEATYDQLSQADPNSVLEELEAASQLLAIAAVNE